MYMYLATLLSSTICYNVNIVKQICVYSTRHNDCLLKIKTNSLQDFTQTIIEFLRT
jgi:hypothetical protein